MLTISKQEKLYTNAITTIYIPKTCNQSLPHYHPPASPPSLTIRVKKRHITYPKKQFIHQTTPDYSISKYETIYQHAMLYEQLYQIHQISLVTSLSGSCPWQSHPFINPQNSEVQ